MKCNATSDRKIFRKRSIGWPLLLGLAGIATAAAAAILPHDQIIGYPNENALTPQAFKPYLKVFSGCVPFPAVDAAGNVSGGLQAAGAKNGHCSSSTGQVYVRAWPYRGETAIMYSWYFPKDQNVDGPANNGHRHDWENVVVWVSDFSPSGRVNAVSYSDHAKYIKETHPPLYGKHPLVGYQQNPWPLDHSLVPTLDRGGEQPLVTWGTLSSAARQTLNTYNFGKANVPFNDSNFFRNLDKAYYR